MPNTTNQNEVFRLNLKHCWSRKFARTLLALLVTEQYAFTRSAAKRSAKWRRAKNAWMQIRLNIYKALTPQAFPYCGKWNYRRQTLTQNSAGQRLLFKWFSTPNWFSTPSIKGNECHQQKNKFNTSRQAVFVSSQGGTLGDVGRCWEI